MVKYIPLKYDLKIWKKLKVIKDEIDLSWEALVFKAVMNLSDSSKGVKK